MKTISSAAPGPDRKRRSLLKVVMGGGAAVFLAVCLLRAEPPVGLPPGAKVLNDISYVKDGHARQKLDLYLPEKPSGALLVYIHGGGWLEGDKAPLFAVGMMNLGYTMASINYRFSSDAVFPAQIQDCKAALRWLRAHAAEYGYDPKRVAVMGDSAGGHLVTLLAATGGTKEFDVGEYLDQPSNVVCGIDYYGPTDIVNYQPENDNPHIQRSGDQSILVRLLGGPVEERKELAEKASPTWWADKNCAPLYILHGTVDPLVPLKQSEVLADKLKSLNVEVTLDVIEGGGHGGPAFFEKVRVNNLILFLQNWLQTPSQ